MLAAALRRAGIRVLIYVDDFLLALRTCKEACDARPIIEAAFLASGLTRARLSKRACSNPARSALPTCLVITS